MRVTVIPSDRFIRRDDDAANLSSWPFNDSNVHAIQWYDTYGEIEYNTTPKPPNLKINAAGVLLPYLEALDEYLAQRVDEPTIVWPEQP